MSGSGVGHALGIERSCALVACALSEGRREGARPPERDAQLLVAEAGVDPSVAERLVKCATSIRSADDVLHFEPPSTRVLVAAAKLVAAGATELDAAEVCILAPLCSEGALTDGLRELAAATLKSD